MKKPTIAARLLKRFGFVPEVSQRSFFQAAIQNRLTSDWNAFQSGPSQELYGSLFVLRNRARDLERNNPLVKRYLNLVAENVVGHKGIRLQCRNTLPSGQQNVTANAAIEAAWNDWGRPETCSTEGYYSWTGLLQHVMKVWARDGECFLRIIRQTDYGFALQLLDADLIDEWFNRAASETENEVRLGVEVDRWGRPVAYHVFTGYLTDLTSKTRTRMRIPAEEILHLFIPRRAGQVRGESSLAPVMLALRHLDGYTEAELVAARTAAAKMGFITNAEGGVGTDLTAPLQADMEAAPGLIDRLAVGEQFTGWDPTHPSMNFGAFVVQIEKIIAGGLNVAYSSLSGDLREVNYSSIRAGLLQERDAWRSLQCWVSDHLCERVYRLWREVAWASGKLSLRMPPQEYNDHIWQPRGWAWIDPLKDVQAAMLECAAGFTSPQRIVGEDGDDFEEILIEKQAAEALAAQYDVDLMLPTGVINGNAQEDTAAAQESDALANGDGGSGGDGSASGGGRAHPRVALLRSAR